MGHIRKGQFWSMDAIMAVAVFMIAFILVLTIVVELGEDDKKVDLERQAMTISSTVAADRPISFLRGVDVDEDALAYMTSRPYEDLRGDFAIDSDFCIYFEDPETRRLIPISTTTGVFVGIGDPGVIISGEPCDTQMGVCEDLDGDGFGDGPDCEDADPNDDPSTGAFVTPETVDDWCDGIDNDDDDIIDEDADPLEGIECGIDASVCSKGVYTCGGMAGMLCVGAVWPTTELCDGIDNDCDGAIDETCVTCIDSDLDGHYTSTSDPSCGPIDDCDDSDAGRHPGLADRCGDGIDNNCDGVVDEGCVPLCADVDRDGHQDKACGGVDCNDADSRVNPDAVEICDDGIDNDCDLSMDCTDSDCAADVACVVPPVCTADEVGFCADGLDNDCDGRTDCMDADCDRVDPACPMGVESLPPPACPDSDGDGFNDISCGGTDCNDAALAIHPGAGEICADGIDQDCDGSDIVDDTDGDGVYDPAVCLNGLDCDDTDPDVYSGAVEFCDWKDNDCDGLVDNIGFALSC